MELSVMSPRSLSVVLVVAALAAGPAHAGGFGIPDIGVRRTAMGAVIGRPDEGAAIYHNPAGLVLQHGWHLYLSMGLAVVRSEFQLQPWAESDRFLGVTPGADGYYAPRPAEPGAGRDPDDRRHRARSCPASSCWAPGSTSATRRAPGSSARRSPAIT